MKKIVLVLTKSPNKTGRFGPVEFQDWHRTLERVYEFQKDIPSEVLIPSGVQVKGFPHEIDLYRGACQALKIEGVHFLREGLETYRQMMIGKEKASGSKKLFVACGFLHFPRVWWIARREDIKVAGFIIGFGWPRISDFFWDPVLTFVYPFFDLLGKKDFFLSLVEERRRRGIL